MSEQITSESKQVDFDYLKGTVPVYVIGDYGIAPWGNNRLSVFSSSSSSTNKRTAKWIWYSQYANTLAPSNTEPIKIQYIYENKSGTGLDVNLYVWLIIHQIYI